MNLYIFLDKNNGRQVGVPATSEAEAKKIVNDENNLVFVSVITNITIKG